MICDGCGIDKTITVETTIGLARINPRTGNTKLEKRTTRLCLPCGGGLKPVEVLLDAMRVAPNDDLHRHDATTRMLVEALEKAR